LRLNYLHVDELIFSYDNSCDWLDQLAYYFFIRATQTKTILRFDQWLHYGVVGRKLLLLLEAVIGVWFAFLLINYGIV